MSESAKENAEDICFSKKKVCTETVSLLSDAKDGAEDLLAINRELQAEISERKKAQEQLENTRNFLENVFQAVPTMLISVDSLGIITQWNKATEKFTGIPASEAESGILWEKAPFLAPYRMNFERVASSSAPEELRMVEAPGAQSKFLNIFIYPLAYNGSGGAVIQIEDMTEVQKKDEFVRQAQKMDTMGNLASGLAHDFNNVIGGIKATVSSIRFSMQTNSINIAKLKADLDKDLAIIEDSVQHGSDMVEQLRSLSKKKEKDFSSVDIAKAVKSVLRICKNTFPRSIDISSSLGDEPAMVKAYPTQLEQALLNLCVNASHAMTIMRGEKYASEGGSLSISLEKVSPGKHFSSILPGAHEGKYWLLRIWDTGVGMSQEILSKIFDPFFTTKDKSNGTGLGLSMVYNIIQQHKGFIEVYSEPGNGSIFNIFLPVDNDEQERLEAEKKEKELRKTLVSSDNIEEVLMDSPEDKPSLTVRKKKRIVFR